MKRYALILPLVAVIAVAGCARHLSPEDRALLVQIKETSEQAKAESAQAVAAAQAAAASAQQASEAASAASVRSERIFNTTQNK